MMVDDARIVDITDKVMEEELEETVRGEAVKIKKQSHSEKKSSKVVSFCC